MFVPLLYGGVVLEMDDRGRVIGKLNGLGDHLAGLAIDDQGQGILAGDEPDRILTVDLERMRLEASLDVGDRCGEPREAVIVGRRAVVTCASNSRVAILEREPTRMLKSILVAERWPLVLGGEPHIEQARALTLLPRLS